MLLTNRDNLDSYIKPSYIDDRMVLVVDHNEPAVHNPTGIVEFCTIRMSYIQRYEDEDRGQSRG